MSDITATVSSSPITATVSGSGNIAASVGSSAVNASVAGGIGPQGPAGATGATGAGGGTTLSNDTPLSPGTPSAGTSESASRSDHRHAAPAIGDISGLQTAIDGKQAAGSYAAASHTHTSSQISDFATAVSAAAPSTTNASLLTSGTLDAARLPASAVLTNDARLSDARTPTAHVHAIGDVTGLQTSLDGKQAAGSYAAASHTHTSSQISDFATAVSAAAPSTTNASLLTSGTLDAARLPASAVLTSDTRLSDARTPTAHVHAIGDVTGLQTSLDGKQAAGSYAAATHTHTLSALTQSSATSGQLVAWNGSAWAPTSPNVLEYATTSAFPATGVSGSIYLATDTGRAYRWASSVYQEVGPIAAPISSAADISSGTLSDSRLSANVILASALAARQHQTTAVIDTVDRQYVGTSSTLASGGVYWSFFTPAYTLTVSQISISSGNSTASGVTLARLGLYTADASGSVTLVARSASDTTMLGTANTIYTRSLDTTGGYPSSYTLNAGSRYAAAFIIVGTGAGTVQSALCNSTIAALSPRVQGIRNGNSDLVTSHTSAQYNGTVSFVPWFRLS